MPRSTASTSKKTLRLEPAEVTFGEVKQGHSGRGGGGGGGEEREAGGDGAQTEQRHWRE